MPLNALLPESCDCSTKWDSPLRGRYRTGISLAWGNRPRNCKSHPTHPRSSRFHPTDPRNCKSHPLPSEKSTQLAIPSGSTHATRDPVRARPGRARRGGGGKGERPTARRVRRWRLPAESRPIRWHACHGRGSTFWEVAWVPSPHPGARSRSRAAPKKCRSRLSTSKPRGSRRSRRRCLRRRYAALSGAVFFWLFSYCAWYSSTNSPMRRAIST